MAQLKALVDTLLSGVSSAYIPKGFIAESILPSIKSKQKSGLLGKYGNSHLRLELNFKGGRGEYRRAETISRESASFQIKGHGLEGLVTPDDYANVTDPYDAEKDETMGLTTALLIEKEYLVASALTSTAVMTQNVTLAGNQKFSDYLNSDPIARFSAMRAAVIAGCGMMPDTAMMDVLVWDKLRYHPQILDALGFKENRPGGLSLSELASAMGVEQVLLAQARYNSAKEGQADAFTSIWGKDIVFGVCPKKAEPYQVSLGYLVQPEGKAPRKVYKYAVNNPPESTGILTEDNYDALLSNVAAGYLIKDAIA